MMKDIEHFLEDSPHRDIKLNEVFNKITDILQQQTVVTPSKQKMSCDVIETILPERSIEPIDQGRHAVDYLCIACMLSSTVGCSLNIFYPLPLF